MLHATLVEGGQYLWRCLGYIELNMVRCGVVNHPREWAWGGYHEIMGQRQRYRLVDLERLCWRLATSDLTEVQCNLEAALAEAIAQGQVKREPIWTESLAVGSAGYVAGIRPLILSRRETEVSQSSEGFTVLHESAAPYGQKRASKRSPSEGGVRY